MDSDKIESNHSYNKLKNELEGIETLKALTSLFPLFDLNSKELRKELNEASLIKSQFDRLIKAPDKFNTHYANMGWIAHESMNSDLLFQCINYADKNEIEIGEQELTEYYSSEKMRWLLHRLKGIEAFSNRYNLFLSAFEDTLAGRYHAAVPLLLMMIDGAVKDIDKGKGFFAENTDMIAWDSIAAHSTGLAVLKEVFNRGRYQTTKEDLTLPYRHGILHGMDLGYANKTVTAKCWAALFAIRDWADTIKQGKRNPPSTEPELSEINKLNQLKDTLNEYNANKKLLDDVSKKIEDWKPRDLVIGSDLNEKGASIDYKDYSPEQEAMRFAEYWEKNNYGAIAKQIHQFAKVPVNTNHDAKRIRNIFQGKKLIDYKIINVTDCAPSISEVSMIFLIEHKDQQYNRQVTLRLIYEGADRELLVLGDKEGQWKFIDHFFHKIEYVET